MRRDTWAKTMGYMYSFLHYQNLADFEFCFFPIVRVSKVLSRIYRSSLGNVLRFNRDLLDRGETGWIESQVCA
jgi:hypothetical protein